MPTALSHILWRVLRLVLALTLAVSATAYAAPPAKKPTKKSIVKRVVAHLKAPPSSKAPAPTAAVERLGHGFKLYLDGQYDAAKKELRQLDTKQMQNGDYVLYLLAQSELLSGEPKAAREHFHELTLVPNDVPQPIRDEADYWIGTTKFKMRRDYDIAAQKLLAIWSRLPGDDHKAEALFHGARAWSRADKDDEAQKGYRDLLQKYPRSKFSSEASFLIGWLDFNRGKYKEAIPALEETLKRYGGSQFGDDARWYL